MNTIDDLHDVLKQECMKHLKDEELSNFNNTAVLRRKIGAIFHQFLRSNKVAISSSERQAILGQVTSDIIGFGPVIKYIYDPRVTEIMINGHDEIFLEKNGKLELADTKFQDRRHLQYFVEKIISPLGKRVNECEPYIDARLPSGARVNVICKPVSTKGTVVTIRKFVHHMFRMEELVKIKTLTQEAADFLSGLVRMRKNIVICGASGAGKTTLLNILVNYIPAQERTIVIEDTMELQMEGKHSLSFEAKPANVDGNGGITIREILMNALHMRPDRIIVGEVRSDEVIDMIQAMTTGHEGSMTTLHANSAQEALDRFEMLALMANSNFSQAFVRRQIINAIDFVVHMVRLANGERKICHISEIIKDAKDELKLEKRF